jgi:hypothetical protein
MTKLKADRELSNEILSTIRSTARTMSPNTTFSRTVSSLLLLLSSSSPSPLRATTSLPHLLAKRVSLSQRRILSLPPFILPLLLYLPSLSVSSELSLCNTPLSPSVAVLGLESQSRLLLADRKGERGSEVVRTGRGFILEGGISWCPRHRLLLFLTRRISRWGREGGGHGKTTSAVNTERDERREQRGGKGAIQNKKSNRLESRSSP